MLLTKKIVIDGMVTKRRGDLQKAKKLAKCYLWQWRRATRTIHSVGRTFLHTTS